jgi:hypothetical protein
MANITGNSGNNRLTGTSASDRMLGLGGNDWMSGLAGNDTIAGATGNDTGIGGSGSDLLFGGAGSDQLFGDAGRDTIVGGTGRDHLYGGAGADTFRFDDPDAGDATAGPLSDVIYDFTEADILDLRDADILYVSGGPDPQRGGVSTWEASGSTYVSWNTFGHVHDVQLVGYIGRDVLSQILWYDDDHFGGLGTTARIAPGETVEGTLEIPEDDDFFRVNLTEGRIFTVNLSGIPGQARLQDLYLELLDSDGFLIADAFVGGTAPVEFAFLAERSGAHFLRVDSLAPSPVGDYRLNLTSRRFADDFVNDVTTPGDVEAGDPARGRLEYAGDEDWFRVDLVAGETYTFTVQGHQSGQGTLRDPTLALMDPSGQFALDFNDDAIGFEPQITHTAFETNSFYLAVMGFETHTGTYVLNVSDDPLAA